MIVQFCDVNLFETISDKFNRMERKGGEGRGGRRERGKEGRRRGRKWRRGKGGGR